MNIPLDAIKTFIGGLVIENLALQHRVAELETPQPAEPSNAVAEIAGRGKRPAPIRDDVTGTA